MHPLGFSLADTYLKRAGLDYHDLTHVQEHPDLASCLATVQPSATHVIETGGSSDYTQVRYKVGDALIFGCETRGLSPEQLALFSPTDIHHIPMYPQNRSLNLSNAVALVVYEAWRQNGFNQSGVS